MLYHGAKHGVFDLKAALTEILVAFRRSGTVFGFNLSSFIPQSLTYFSLFTGADCIISYFTPLILRWIAEDIK